MKTKLVYVLTCAPEATYIEQALMAVWSARYHNPDAHIVLNVDDKTDVLLTGKRAEILKYISEKIVIPFEDESLTPMYRSRYIKTQVRELVSGDFLFVDCDTICCRSLVEIDDFTCEVGAVGDNNTLFQEDIYKDDTIQNVLRIGCNISEEEYYFSSGVMYCKDTEKVHQLYQLWHQYWIEGTDIGVNIDQPAMAKANIELGHIIMPIDDCYNCVLYTKTVKLPEAAVLHISDFKQTSVLFKKNVLQQIREVGITPWVAKMIEHIHGTYLPFDYAIRYSTISQRMKWIRENALVLKLYGTHISAKYEDWVFAVAVEPIVNLLLRIHAYQTSMGLWVLVKRFKVMKMHALHSNVCSVR